MSENQITTNCHIIPRRFIKNFSYNEKIFFASKNNYWNIERSDNKYLFASKNNVYNYSNEIYPIVNEFEDHFAEKEARISDISRKLILEISNGINNGDFILNKHQKDNIIRIITLLFEKIFYYKARYCLSENGKKVLEEDDLIGIFGHMNGMIPYFTCIFHVLTLSDFYRSVIYSKKGDFFFGDTPFHIYTGGKNIDRNAFFKSYGSSIIFPLTQNIVIKIEHIKRNKIYTPIIGIDDNLNQNLVKEINERILINCDEYIASSNEKLLDSLVKKRKYIKLYTPDIYHFVLKTTLVREINSIKDTVTRYKNTNRIFSKIGLKDMKDEYVEKYYKIDKEFKNPLKTEKYIKIITGWDDFKIKKTIKEKNYISIFLNSKDNMTAINEYFKV